MRHYYLLLAVVGVLMGGCTKKPVVIVTNFDLLPKLKSQMERDIPGVNYEWKRINGIQFFEQYGKGLSSPEAKENHFDITIVQFTEWCYEQDKKGGFLKYDSLETSSLRPIWTDGSVSFKPLLFNALVPVWNPESKISPPKTWKQLFSQEWSGKIAASEPLQNMRLKIGYKSLSSFLNPSEFANVGTLGVQWIKDPFEVLSLIEKNNASFGVVPLDVLAEAVGAGSKLRVIPFDDPMLFLAQYAAIASDAKDKASAKKIFDWLYKYDFQHEMSEQFNVVSGVTGVPANASVVNSGFTIEKLFVWNEEKRSLLVDAGGGLEQELEKIVRAKAVVPAPQPSIETKK